MEVSVGTLDVRQLKTLHWGPIGAMFPSFVAEIELARYMSRALSEPQCRSVRVEPHRDASGLPSSHLYDVFYVSELDQAE